MITDVSRLRAMLAPGALLLCLASTANLAIAQERGADSLAAKVDFIFSTWDDPSSPGCALGVIKDGEFILRRGYGMANLEHDVPIGSETVFYIASTSKQFAAATMILAAEQGLLSLDDDIRKHVPELPDYGQTITIRHLLHHTSGIRDYLTLWSMAGEEFADIHEPQEALDIIVRQKALNFDPGEEYLYSNSGYFLLSVIIERASGKTLKEFADEYIFEPLAMENSHFHDDHTHISKKRAIGHVRDDDGQIQMYVSNFDQVGSGGLHTSVDDLLLWDRNFYEDRLGQGALLAELHRRGILNNGDTLTYAAGLGIDEYRGLRTVAHGGAAQGYRTEMLRFPDQRFTVICLCNLGETNPSQLARRVAEVYLANEMAETPPAAATSAGDDLDIAELSQAQLAKWVGSFRNPDTGTIWSVSVDGNGLRVTLSNFTFRLIPSSETEFVARGTPIAIDVRFEDQGAGKPKLIHAEIEGQGTPTYEEIDLHEPNDAQLAEYAGLYYSEELDYSWPLYVEDGELYIEEVDNPLNPTIVDEFRNNVLILNFLRDDRGAVTGMLVDAGRVRNLRFEKTED